HVRDVDDSTKYARFVRARLRERRVDLGERVLRLRVECPRFILGRRHRINDAVVGNGAAARRGGAGEALDHGRTPWDWDNWQSRTSKASWQATVDAGSCPLPLGCVPIPLRKQNPKGVRARETLRRIL